MPRKSQQSGKRGQNEAIDKLQSLGFLTAQEIATPVSLTPVDPKRSIFRVAWKEKVSGDHTAILMGGLFVLAETKTTTGDENLAYSRLEDHQRRNLTNHAKAGGLSLLIWVSAFGIYVMEWKVDGIDGYNLPRQSIKPRHAEVLHSELLSKLEEYEAVVKAYPVSLWDGRELDLNWVYLNL